MSFWLEEAGEGGNSRPEKKQSPAPEQPKSAKAGGDSQKKALETLKGKNEQAFEYISQIIKLMPTMRDIKDLNDKFSSLESSVNSMKGDLDKAKSDLQAFNEPNEQQRQDLERRYSSPYSQSPKEYWSSYRPSSNVANEYPSAMEYLNLSGNNFRDYLKKTI